MSNHKYGQLFLHLLAISLALMLAYHQYQSVLSDPHRCGSLATEGVWSQRLSDAAPVTNAHWQPSGCMLRRYSASDIEACTNPGQSLFFVGDSLIRQVFWATASKLNKTRAQQMRPLAPKHQNLVFEHSHGGSPKRHNTSLRFIWDPYLNLTEGIYTHGRRGGWLPYATNDTPARFVVVGAGLWHARYLEHSYLGDFSKSTHKFKSFSERNRTAGDWDKHGHHYRLPSDDTSIAIIPVLNPYQPNLSEDRATSMTPDRIREMNSHIYSMQQDHDLDVFWSFLRMTKDPLAYEADGIHVTDAVALARSDVLLNYYCNRFRSGDYPHDTSCCMEVPPLNRIQSCFIVVAGAVAAIGFSIKMASCKHVLRLTGITCLRTTKVTHAAAVLASCLLYCFVADRTMFFGKVAKDLSLLDFVTLSGISLLLGLSSITLARQSKSSILGPGTSQDIAGNGILSREQTDEWKGWMQIIILFYHYFGMSKVLWVYQVIRLLVASYLFMTGYGHTMYFMQTGDFSLRRITSVLFRLNMLSCLLPYIMRTEYNFYYFPALCSFWCMVVFGTLWRTSSILSKRMFAVRIVTSTLLVSTFVLCPGVLENAAVVLQKLYRLKLDAHEFRFRASLDLFIVYYGMVLAFLHVKFQEQIETRRYTGLSRPHLVLRPRFIAPICVTVLGLYTWCAYSSPHKYAYNKLHPIISPFAVLAYIGLRNAGPKLRASYSRFFAWIGRFSLETFILQYHIWLAGDTEGLLHIPGFDRIQTPLNTMTLEHVYWLHFAIVTTCFVWLSCKLARATNVLTVWFAGSQIVSAVQPCDIAELFEEKNLGHRLTEMTARFIKFDLRIRIILVLALLWTFNWLW